jgi:hypothetical protein
MPPTAVIANPRRRRSLGLARTLQDLAEVCGVEIRKVPVLYGILGLLKVLVRRTGRHFRGGGYRSFEAGGVRGRPGCRLTRGVAAAG